MDDSNGPDIPSRRALVQALHAQIDALIEKAYGHELPFVLIVVEGPRFLTVSNSPHSEEILLSRVLSDALDGNTHSEKMDHQPPDTTKTH